MDNDDPRCVLAGRLRALRLNTWPGVRITQPKLARALGGDVPLSVPLISSWESQTSPVIPPLSRLDHYAVLFATPRSFAGDEPRLVSPDEMTDEELRAMSQLKDELHRLRGNALAANRPAGTLRGSTPVATAQLDQEVESLSSGPWRFADGHAITIVCAQWPPDMRAKIPYTDPDDPNYIRLLTFSELDSLYELNGHLRAANPATVINLRAADQLDSDDYASHLIVLGGIDWNTATRSVLDALHLPVRQVADWDVTDGQYFEVEKEKSKKDHFRPVLRSTGNKQILQEDVSLFARAPNPYNRQHTVTMCNGMYGQGTYGAVRALTDRLFRDRNAEYLASRFGDAETYCLLTRVRIVDRATITPDWTQNEDRLYEWPGPPDVSR